MKKVQMNDMIPFLGVSTLFLIRFFHTEAIQSCSMMLRPLLIFWLTVYSLRYRTRPCSNKMHCFFDTVQKSSLYHYLFIKSYFSQLFLVIGFGLIGWWASDSAGVSSVLNVCYWIAGLTAGAYLMYPPAGKNNEKLVKNGRFRMETR